jgi:hypothetical protein
LAFVTADVVLIIRVFCTIFFKFVKEEILKTPKIRAKGSMGGVAV